MESKGGVFFQKSEEGGREMPPGIQVCGALVREPLTVCAPVTDLSLPPLTLQALCEALPAVPTLSLPQSTFHLLPLLSSTAWPLWEHLPPPSLGAWVLPA